MAPSTIQQNLRSLEEIVDLCITRVVPNTHKEMYWRKNSADSKEPTNKGEKSW